MTTACLAVVVVVVVGGGGCAVVVVVDVVVCVLAVELAAARSVLGLKCGTPEPLVPPILVPPNFHSSTSPGLGTSPSGPSELYVHLFWPAGASQNDQ